MYLYDDYHYHQYCHYYYILLNVTRMTLLYILLYYILYIIHIYCIYYLCNIYIHKIYYIYYTYIIYINIYTYIYIYMYIYVRDRSIFRTISVKLNYESWAIFYVHLKIQNIFQLLRSSHPKVFLEKCVLKICNKFTVQNPCQSVISIKLLCNFIEITFRHWFSPVNSQHIFKTPFTKNTPGRLLRNCFKSL